MSDELPEGWAASLLPEIIYFAGRIGWRGLKAEEYTQSGAILLSVHNLNNGPNVDFTNVNYVSMERYDESPEIKLNVNDVLLTKDGAGIGKTGFVADLPTEATINSSLLLLRSLGALHPKFLFYSLIGPGMQALVKERITGSTTPHLFQKDIRHFELLVPPLAEQQRIVAKVESLLARVNAARQRLAKVPAILKRFRQSVLAAACSGRLTADWREEQTFDRQKTLGRDFVEYAWWDSDFPQSWSWNYLSAVADMRLGKMLDQVKNVGVATPYLRNINVRWFAFDLRELLEIRIQEEECNKYCIEDGDVLVCEGGEPGRAAVWRKGKTNVVFQKAIHRIRLSPLVLPEWLVFNIKLDAETQRLEMLFTGSTIKHLTGVAFKKYPVVIPPLPEQHEIVRRVEALFRLADTIEKRVTAATARAEKLTQAILAKAFRGELVPTEAELARREGRTYEPASALLDRIRAERAATADSKPSPKKLRQPASKSLKSAKRP
jgi:type I restriction enzyme S subunit